MDAIIVAGGRGSRLGELTKATPKALLRVGGMTILERLLEHLRNEGLNKIYISVGHLARQIRDHVGDGRRLDCQVRYLDEGDTALGTAGWLSVAPDELRNSGRALVVINGDLITNFPVGWLVKRQEASAASMVIGVREYEHQIPFGVVDYGGTVVSAVREKPVQTWQVLAGVYLFASGEVPYPAIRRRSSMVDVINTVVASGRQVESVLLPGMWMDIGRPADLTLARSMFDPAAA